MGLGMILELPMIVINVQRGGPSTGLPTKTEQSDLLQAMFGRNGESPLPILAPCSPADCFDVAIEAWRIATECMVPVLISRRTATLPTAANRGGFPKFPPCRKSKSSIPKAPTSTSRSCLTRGTNIWRDRGRFPARPD